MLFSAGAGCLSLVAPAAGVCFLALSVEMRCRALMNRVFELDGGCGLYAFMPLRGLQ
jgi:hypothetical protein